MINPAEIKIRNLSIEYKKAKKGFVKAIENINLDIPRNKITMIIGPSGCGKSTLLKSINRLHDINEEVSVQGSLEINGEDIYYSGRPVPELRRRVGLIHQKPVPLPLSIFKNIAYGLKIHNNIHKDEVERRVIEALKKVHLWDEVKDRLDSPAIALSLGQQQRLSIARAIAIKPEVLLCDEITSALDPISSGKIEQLLVTLSEDYTIVWVSHILRQVRRMADYVVFLYMGRMVECGEKEQFFEDPQDSLTQNYIRGLFT
ncbi:MAG: phosphate ABC transporter ATP-binding protein [Candidatus Marinimicrobia bacterium]|nr:phosphate ABC transporter ATP-binding protein [Candidatus Neomarinimicrobiota bacterium]